jgi:hypothetical protein
LFKGGDEGAGREEIIDHHDNLTVARPAWRYEPTGASFRASPLGPGAWRADCGCPRFGANQLEPALTEKITD